MSSKYSKNMYYVVGGITLCVLGLIIIKIKYFPVNTDVTPLGLEYEHCDRSIVIKHGEYIKNEELTLCYKNDQIYLYILEANNLINTQQIHGYITTDEKGSIVEGSGNLTKLKNHRNENHRNMQNYEFYQKVNIYLKNH